MAHKLVACVAIPHVLAHVARQRLPAAAHPLVVAAHAGDRALVVDVCPQAAARGLRPGIFVGNARRQCPSLLVATLDGGQPRALLRRSSRCSTRTPTRSSAIAPAAGRCRCMPWAGTSHVLRPKPNGCSGS